MSQKLISQLLPRPTFDGSVQIPVQDHIQTWRVSGQQLADFLGSSGGALGINFLQQSGITPTFENGSVGGWNLYANDTPSATPEIDPTGTVSDQVTFEASDSSPLRGEYSGLLTKDDSNRQGHGIRTDEFTIDNADTQKALFVSFDYEVSSNFVAGDIQVFATDGTNILEVTNKSLRAGKQKFVGAFFATDSTSYRLIFHVASTNASAYTLKIDNVSVGPSDKLVSIQDTEELELDLTGSGDFTGGLLKFTRNGKIVTVDVLEQATHSANGNPSSASGLLPTRFRPETEAQNTYATASTGTFNIRVGTDGTISFAYLDYSGTPAGRTTSGTARSGALAYAIADANYQGIGKQTEIVGLSEVEPWQNWTPTLSNTTNNSITMFRYQRVGPTLKFMGVIDWSDNGAGQSFRITNLPFAPKSPPPRLNIGSASGTVDGSDEGYFSASTEWRSTDNSIRFIHDGNEIDGSQFSSGGRLRFNGSYEINEADAFSRIVPVTQTHWTISPPAASGLSSSTDLQDIEGSSIYLPSGTYHALARASLNVNSDTALTTSGGRITLSSSTNVNLISTAYTSLSGTLTSSGIEQRAPTVNSGVFSWPGGNVKLRGNIATSGGSNVTRRISTINCLITRLGDA